MKNLTPFVLTFLCYAPLSAQNLPFQNLPTTAAYAEVQSKEIMTLTGTASLEVKYFFSDT